MARQGAPPQGSQLPFPHQNEMPCRVSTVQRSGNPQPQGWNWMRRGAGLLVFRQTLGQSNTSRSTKGTNHRQRSADSPQETSAKTKPRLATSRVPSIGQHSVNYHFKSTTCNRINKNSVLTRQATCQMITFLWVKRERTVTNNTTKMEIPDEENPPGAHCQHGDCIHLYH